MLKQILKKIIVAILTLESKIVLWRFKPKIIAVTGSVGKTSTKDAIFTALSGSVKIRKNQKSFNSEIGTPLTILGLDNAWNDPLLWLKNIYLGAVVIFKKNYPEWLVLEIGVDRPGDIARVASWIKPNVVVITALPDIPVHVEYFSSPDAIVKEKLSLIKYMKKDGVVILNADDPLVFAEKDKTKHVVFTYGSEPNSTVSFSNAGITYEETDGIKIPTGTTFKISYNGSTVPMMLPGVLGIQHILPVAASIAVGLSQNIPFLNMVNAFSKYEPARGRMNIILGKNQSVIIDDTYNASPIAMQKAVDVLGMIETNSNKIAVLGDMLEIGHFSASEHKKIGEQIARLKINILITVGVRAQCIAEGAISSGMNQDNVFVMRNNEDASKIVSEKIKSGSIILVKGSQGVRLEKVVGDLMLDESRKSELLVRQDSAWEKR